jgi:hypothetical protein
VAELPVQSGDPELTEESAVAEESEPVEEAPNDEKMSEATPVEGADPGSEEKAQKHGGSE